MSDLLPRDTRLENNVQQEAALGRISVMLEKHKRQSHCSKPESEMQYVFVVHTI